MTKTDEQESEKSSSLPRRAAERLAEDFQHDIRGIKQKGVDVVPSAFILFVEKWLGFWMTIVGVTLSIGLLGLGFVYGAEFARTVPILSSRVQWLLDYIWVVGLLFVLTYGAVLFSLVIVSAARFVLWVRDNYLKFWNRDTPPFTKGTSEKESKQWPPSNKQRKEALEHAKNYLSVGSIFFISVVSVLLLIEQFATETLNQLLSSRFVTVIGNSIDIGIVVLDFDSALGTAAPNASQPEVVFFILFFVLPAAVMAIAARNLVFLVEARIRDHIENVRDGDLLNWSTVVLLSMFVYSLTVCASLIIQWT